MASISAPLRCVGSRHAAFSIAYLYQRTVRPAHPFRHLRTRPPRPDPVAHSISSVAHPFRGEAFSRVCLPGTAFRCRPRHRWVGTALVACLLRRTLLECGDSPPLLCIKAPLAGRSREACFSFFLQCSADLLCQPGRYHRLQSVFFSCSVFLWCAVLVGLSFSSNPGPRPSPFNAWRFLSLLPYHSLSLLPYFLPRDQLLQPLLLTTRFLRWISRGTRPAVRRIC
jgi:hypothetical protein